MVWDLAAALEDAKDGGPYRLRVRPILWKNADGQATV